MEKIVEKVGKAVQFVYDGYLKAVDFAHAHPHVMVWALAASIASRLVF